MPAEVHTIVITGASSGVGLALLHAFLGGGHRVIAVAREGERLQALRGMFPQVVTVACDLSQQHQVEALAEQLIAMRPAVSTLIHCAGVQTTAHLCDEDFDYDSIARETTINFLAPVWLSYLMLDHLLAERARGAQARIVCVGSGLALQPKTDSAVYCASKAALRAFTHSLRGQLAPHGVRVVEVVLPLVDTPMTAGRGRNKLSAARAAHEIVAGLARGRDTVHVGKARWLPLLMRLSPALVRRIMNRA